MRQVIIQNYADKNDAISQATVQAQDMGWEVLDCVALRPLDIMDGVPTLPYQSTVNNMNKRDK